MASVVKVKPSNQDGPSKGKSDTSVNKKKIESSDKQSPVNSKNRSVATVMKTEIKSKATSSKTTTTTTTTTTTKTTKVREKKVFSLPGQKYDRPEEREPLRIFYGSLSKQIPSSEMAEFWMMEHGLLSPERAKKAFEKKQRKQKQLRTGTPIKSPPPSRSEMKPQPSKNGDVKAKKRIMNESDDDDFILSPKRRKG